MEYGATPVILLRNSTAKLFCEFQWNRDALQTNPRPDRLAAVAELAEGVDDGGADEASIQKKSSCFAINCELLVLLVKKNMKLADGILISAFFVN